MMGMRGGRENARRKITGMRRLPTVAAGKIPGAGPLFEKGGGMPTTLFLSGIFNKESVHPAPVF